MINVFLSYNWNDGALADEIDQALCNGLSSCGVVIHRDVRDIGPFNSIYDYMKSIRNNEYAVMIISKAFLRSSNCMFEVIELLKEKKYQNKILPVVTEDANVYDPIYRAGYIQFWETKIKKLEEAIQPLDLANSVELATELRKYKSIATNISVFMQHLVKTNNPSLEVAVERIIEKIADGCKNTTDDYEETHDDLEVKLDATHYTFLKYASKEVVPLEIGQMVGILKLGENRYEEDFYLPMIVCEVTNRSNHVVRINEPVMKGKIEMPSGRFAAVSFMCVSEYEKVLKPNAKTSFNFFGKMIIPVIKAFLDEKIENVSVKDNYDFEYSVPKEQIEEVARYFKQYCCDFDKLEEKFANYGE